MVKFPISCIFVLLLAVLPAWAGNDSPPPGGRETAVTREAQYQDGLIRMDFDYPGSRGYWIDGISILGMPDFGPQAMGISSPARRMPSGMSGLYSRGTAYRRYGLALDAPQGYATQGVYTAPIDTPITHLAWERYGFDGNSFLLDFRRLMTDSIGFDLGVASHSTSGTGIYRYQDIVHQMYTGTLKRDSSRVPLVGRNLDYGTMHLKPAMTWYGPRSSLSVQASFLNIDNDDAPRLIYIKDTLTYSKFTRLPDPWNFEASASSYGFSWNWRPGQWSVDASHRISALDMTTNEAPATLQRIEITQAADSILVDSVYYDTTYDERYTAQSGEFDIQRSGPGNPALRFRYEFLDLDEYLGTSGMTEQTAFQDRQTGFLELSDTLGNLGAMVQLGAQRNSSAFDKRDWASAWSSEATYALPWHLSVAGAWQRDTRFPDVQETHVLRTGRLMYPNANLRPERRDRQEGRIQWSQGPFFYTLGLRTEYADNAIVPQWTIQKNLANLTPEQAFTWVNRHHIESRDWFCRAGFALGNWQATAERGATIERTRTWDVASRYYKGSVLWNNRFVEDRLGVEVRWDAQWHGTRWDYVIDDRYSIARPVELAPYLMLDFEARMRILSFSLYTRIENMNHSLQTPAAGYVPEGISFRYGIEWTLDD